MSSNGFAPAEKRQTEQLQNQYISDARNRIVLEETKTIVTECNLDTNINYISPIISHYICGNYNGRKISQVLVEDGIVHSDDLKKFKNYFDCIHHEDITYEKIVIRLKSIDSTYRWYKFAASKLPDENGIGRRLIVTINDVHEETVAQKALKYRAEFDSLTGIYNKVTFYQQTQALLKQTPEKKFFLVRLDINRFKVINDLFGMEAGNILLQFIAEKIRTFCEGIATYGRLNSDIFCMCIPEKENIIEEFIHEMEIALAAYPLKFQIISSFGIYPITDPTLTISGMCDRANLALKTIKDNYNKHFAYYDESLRSSLLKEQFILTNMNAGIEQHQFVIYLQPKYNMESKSISGAEALVRWNHPERGLIPPNEFIPIFEKNGFIIKLDEYVCESVCKLLRRWIDLGYSPQPISVNVSRKHLYNPDLCEFLIQLTKKYDLNPALLELELTETAYTENPQMLYSQMGKLQNHGFIFLMDDFGSGYSSLNMLKDVPVNILKIDLNFLKESAKTSYGRGRTILESIIDMTQRLQLPIIAEGVETAEQANFLLSAGCYFAQGYYYAKPMPEEQYEDLLIQQLKFN